MSLYTDLIEVGIEVGHWQSDLYFPRTPQTIEILSRHPDQKRIAEVFSSNIDGVLTFDVPFAFDPFWEDKGL